MSNCLSQTAEEIVTEISMSSNNSPWLVVEGGTDARFFSSRELKKKPIIVVANGWKNVVCVISKVVEESISSSVFGFIDRDYREELGITVDEEYVVVTDFRDIEVSMFESCALDRILVELGSSRKYPKLECSSVDVKSIREHIYSVAKDMGVLRYYGLLNNKSYNFKKLDYSKFVCQKTLEINRDKLISQINSHSDDNIDSGELVSALSQSLPDIYGDSRYLCSGHDLALLLGIALKKMWGTNNTKETEQEKIESLFRIGYSEDDFFSSSMYKKLDKLLSK